MIGEYPSEATWANNSGDAYRTQFETYQWTPGSGGIPLIWDRYYNMIYRANLILESIPNVSSTTTVKRIEGETHFLRAYAYFLLIRLFDHGYTFGKGAIKNEFISMSYPVQLRKRGYYTGFFGKFGVIYDKIKQMFDESDSYDRRDEYPDKRGYFYKTINGDTTHLTRFTGYQAQEFIKHDISRHF